MSPQADKELPDAVLDTLVERERNSVARPLLQWNALAAQLRDEGLTRATPGLFERPVSNTGLRKVPFHRHGFAVQWSVRIAAGVALLGVGVGLGRGWTGGAAKIVRYATADVRQDDRARNSDGKNRGTEAGGMAIPPEAMRGITLTADSVSGPAVASTAPPTFRSPAEARRVMTAAATLYQRAAAYLAVVGNDKAGAEQPALYQVRLAALDQVLSATRQAMQEAPSDPVLKQYYISSVSARQATLQQLSQALPAGVQLANY